jgi:cytochrome c556
MKTLLKLLFCIVIFAGALGEAYAQFSSPDEAIRYRQSVMFLMSQHFGRMGAMVKEETPYNQETFTGNAMVVETLSRLPWEAFMVPGSDKGDTTLKSSAFGQKAKLNETIQTFEKQTAKLAGTAKTGDFKAVKAQFGEVGKSCKDCHTQFRK